jgi:DisA bacterial checkpoint controller nucleotide-binding
MMKRVISVLRDARHGGTVIFVPTENAGEPSREHPYIDLRYPFADDRARLSFPDLVVGILNRLAQLYGAPDRRRPGPVGWREFEATTDDEIETLDEALFETAHLIAGLAAADGAVVMRKDNELLGFGGMISGRLSDVESVGRALDLEGEKVAEEETGNVGARHRSAYRLAGALPGSVAVVISQDGGVRFVCQKGGRVTYWEQE